jgi:hypothetical protein
MDEIIAGLFVGGIQDGCLVAGDPGWSVYFVHEQFGEYAPASANWAPFVQSYVDNDGYFQVTGVDQAALGGLIKRIDEDLQAGKKVLVHCAEGIERAPLATTCFLHRTGKAPSLEEAFRMVQNKRTQAQDRLEWLERSGWEGPGA